MSATKEKKARQYHGHLNFPTVSLDTTTDLSIIISKDDYLAVYSLSKTKLSMRSMRSIRSAV